MHVLGGRGAEPLCLGLATVTVRPVGENVVRSGDTVSLTHKKMRPELVCRVAPQRELPVTAYLNFQLLFFCIET